MESHTPRFHLNTLSEINEKVFTSCCFFVVCKSSSCIKPVQPGDVYNVNGAIASRHPTHLNARFV